ncbi:hypothetical protein CKY28_01110 [Sphingomonas lenta]|uniref:WYL domain-containing protein n=2 Tax=Sphingomonas lenta TaxID=1141887 RepID=A0A2A2SKM1_9SPHN|nr:hypothetical protein [Sphingomonas lenta]PAX09775.1 hypothetical protein CKY28_01110 [Sphingomonas lenta]
MTDDAPTAEAPRTPAPVDPGATPVVLEAIVKQLCVAATYNRQEVTLAPHILYTRHGELYVDGVVLEREGRPPKELKLGTFKLAGLHPLRITARRFERSGLFRPGEPRYRGETLMAVAD